MNDWMDSLRSEEEVVPRSMPGIPVDIRADPKIPPTPQVKLNRKRKFTSDTQTKRDGKVEEAMAVKKERRLFL